MTRVLVTGWAGFIGSNFVRMLMEERPNWKVYGMDCFTYAARPKFVMEHDQTPEVAPSYLSDIRNLNLVEHTFRHFQPDVIVHFAAESHVCRSLEGPDKFISTNVLGTFNLLEATRKLAPKAIFHHVSTDEVFGEARPGEYFCEHTPYAPRSPYSSSKAASDHLVMSYHHSYGLNTRITNCSNNFGPNQHEEKLIPKTILAAAKKQPMTLYNPGSQVRDWIWVNDHCRGILSAIDNGRPGERYLLGGELELTNLDLVKEVWAAIKAEFGSCFQEFEMVNGRPTDDKRYAIDCGKAKGQLRWKPSGRHLFHEHLRKTVRWYAKELGVKP